MGCFVKEHLVIVILNFCEMDKHDITERADLSKLVRTFYVRIRKDDLVGPIFNAHIKEWDHHMEHITDFWERNLLGTTEFYGNPGMKHMQLDDKQDNTIEAGHFERWLSLWYATLDDLFVGAKAEEAKERATRIGENFFRMILGNRARKEQGPGRFHGGGFSPTL